MLMNGNFFVNDVQVEISIFVPFQFIQVVNSFLKLNPKSNSICN